METYFLCFTGSSIFIFLFALLEMWEKGDVGRRKKSKWTKQDSELKRDIQILLIVALVIFVLYCIFTMLRNST